MQRPAKARRYRNGASVAGEGAGRPVRRDGAAARRAVIRWAWRLFRREWRQQILVLSLLTVAVGASVAGASAAYHAAPSATGEFGAATELIRVDSLDPETLDADLAAAERWFGTIDVIGRRLVPVPGSVQPVEFRTQDPDGVLGAPMLALRAGHYPTGSGEIAVTDGVAEMFRLDLGDRLSLDGGGGRVVGLVENPANLRDEFVLEPAAHAAPAESVTILVDADRERIRAFPSLQSPSVADRRWDAGISTAAGAMVLVASAVALLLVSLVATASFLVLAQRRLRQLGMLAAIGASEKHVRLVMLANGAVVGGIAAVLGAVAGLAGWVVAAPQLENMFGYRVDRWEVPWWVIGACLLLAVGMATLAARWPARTAARVPVVQALSGRPPRPKAARRSTVLAVLFAATGVTCLALADRTNPGIPEHDPTALWGLLLVAGTVATGLAILFISPFAVRVVAAAGTRAPIAARLALRDLGRYHARSGAALAAISLGLAIPVATIIGVTAAEYGAEEGNLSDRQLLVRMVGPQSPFVPELTPAELARFEAEVARIAAGLADPTVTTLSVAIDPRLDPVPDPEGGGLLREAVTLGIPLRDGSRDLLAYVATPELLAHYGLDVPASDPGTDVLTVRTDELRFRSAERRTDPEVVTNVETLAVPAYTSAPTTLLTEQAVQRRGWTTAPGGWFVEASRPLTTDQLVTAREVAADAGLTIEARDQQEDLPVTRTVATAAGVLLALGVLAMTVGLIRAEAAGDLRTLAAAGATSRVRRTLTAVTAGALALAGVLLGTAAAYAGFAAGFLSDLGTISSVPLLHLTIIAVGVPISAAVAGWLLAGGSRPALLGPRSNDPPTWCPDSPAGPGKAISSSLGQQASPHHRRASHCGIEARSAPSVESLPWPG